MPHLTISNYLESTHHSCSFLALPLLRHQAQQKLAASGPRTVLNEDGDEVEVGGSDGRPSLLERVQVGACCLLVGLMCCVALCCCL